MSEVIRVEKVNEVHMRVIADPGLRYELMEYLSFRPPGYQFAPSYKNKVWDGYIRLYNPMKPILYVGLLEYLAKFCVDRDYKLEISSELQVDTQVSKDDIQQLIKQIGATLTPRDYQMEYILNALNNRRSLSLSPTSSGKSFIIYLIQQYYFREYGHRTLIIVPTVALVYQLSSDFVEYGCNEDDIYKILSGVDKKTRKPVVISTWQSLQKQPKEWFDQFKVVLGDEAHLFQAKSLTSIMEKLTDAPYRHGFTGTISSESKVHRLILEGLFGSIKRFVTTKDLMDQGTVADFRVKGIVLKHSPEVKKIFNDAVKEVKKKNKNTNKKINLFNVEKEFVINLERRNNFIRNLVWSLEGQNNLILFDRVEKHGALLEPLLKKDGRILHFIHGGVKGKDREAVRQQVENDNTDIITLKFKDVSIEIHENEEIPLTDGKTIRAHDVTINHDISDRWISYKLKESSKI